MFNWKLIDNVYCLWPPKPELIIEFIGGSFLSASPQISYRKLLEALSRKNFAIHAWRYLPSFDHQLQANQAWKNFRTCRNILEKRISYKIKTLRIGHSLGSKLHLLAPDGGRKNNGLISLSFNNYSVNKSVPAINHLGSRLGIKKEFYPDPIMTIKYISEQYYQPRNLIVGFTNDKLDESSTLFKVLNHRINDKSKLTFLTGDHLTPTSSGILENILVDINLNRESSRANELEPLISIIYNWFMKS